MRIDGKLTPQVVNFSYINQYIKKNSNLQIFERDRIELKCQFPPSLISSIQYIQFCDVVKDENKMF